jgi:RNA polymerase sigma factor (TIGR02999 family)
MHSAHRVTLLLQRIRQGDSRAESELVPLIYDQLHRLAVRQFAGERRGHTLQPTALISELYLRVIADTSIDWQSRAHFYAVAVTTMRRVLVDHARAANAARRPRPGLRVVLDEAIAYSNERAEEVLAVDEALQQLAALDARQARVVEMRFFGGLSIEEIANALGLSERTVKRDWQMARAWLASRLSGIEPS